MLVSKVPPPVRANALPSRVAPVVAVTDASAIMVPVKVVFVPRVAELPTCQVTFWAWAPLIRMTLLLPAAVVSVDTTWKIQTALGSPLPSRVRFPVIPRDG